MAKVCTKCGIEKPLTAFRERKKRQGAGRYRVAMCATCERDYNRKKVKDTYCPERRFNRLLKYEYSMTREQYDTLKDKAGGRCEICQTTLERGSRSGNGEAIDHCHTGGHVRGLLCHNCNKGLGNFKDNQEFLASAIKYLQEKG